MRPNQTRTPCTGRIASGTTHTGECGMRRGFTLIELLIVVAIIAILAAIAVPNFLLAQARAKVSRAKAELRTLQTAVSSYVVDHNRLFPDANDPSTPPDLRGLTFETENHMAPDLRYVAAAIGQYYTFRAQRPLTTPVMYLSSLPRDPFSRIMPFGYDTRESAGNLAYAAMSSAGPDCVVGDWHRSFTETHEAIPYDPTNGTVSRGEIWRAVYVADQPLFRLEYGWEQTP